MVRRRGPRPPFEYYAPQGGALRLFQSFAPEVLIEGGAGTGKSLAVLQKVDLLCRKYNRIRVLLIRKTLKSLRESALVTFEEEVLGDGHPAITGRATRQHRDSYTYPSTRAHIVLAGIDTPSRHMSTQFDVVAAIEATELLLADWEYLSTRCRNWRMPFQQMIADCNPAAKHHWLNRRANEDATAPDDPLLPQPKPGDKKMQRILSRHTDNPRLWNAKLGRWTRIGADYMSRLHNLHGARKSRLLDHEWISEEGLVFPMWQEGLHLLPIREVRDAEGLRVKVYRGDWGGEREFPIRWTQAAMDVGFNHPGCLQIWGWTGHRPGSGAPITEQYGFRLAEVYRSGWSSKQWAPVVQELRRRYRFDIGVCDADASGTHKYLNDHLGPLVGAEDPRIFRPPNKTAGLLPGLDLCRTMLEPDGPFQTPHVMWAADAHPYGKQEDLVDAGKPASSEEEILDFVFPKEEEDERGDDKPDRKQADHGMAAFRYGMVQAWGKDLSALPEAPAAPAPGTKGAVFGTVESLTRAKNGRGHRRW